MSKKNKANLRRRIVGSKNVLQERFINQKKINQINEALTKKNIPELRKLATRGGLVNNGLRRLCWPLLLHYETYDKKDIQEEHKDERQVLLDVDRSFVYYPKGISNAEKKQKQSELNDVIVGILRRHPNLAYYQGFHDICSVLLLVLGNKEAAIKAGENIAMFLLRDAMLDSLEPIMRQLTLLNTLIRLEDQAVADFLENSNTLPYFCLSWVITWCSHDVRDFSKVARLFDFFISSDPLISIYLSARVVIHRRKELLTLECDSAIVHTFLAKFPQYIDMDELISKTIEMYNKYRKDPPLVLQKAINEALDETSCAKLYEQYWLKLKADDPIDYLAVDKIPSPSLPSAKKSMQIKNARKQNNLKPDKIAVMLIIAIIFLLLVISRKFNTNI
ncbi:TBC1 domain family member 20-like [Rhizophagus clarus]|uniref:TBC1 domain family member 20-like n=2 Tax=Rhizophagus clarus TaxID=94130 RepID=A0A8H3KTC1_9GLOM|nr:TBC1 domain family member 20-like [Rhizophagus clarus]